MRHHSFATQHRPQMDVIVNAMTARIGGVRTYTRHLARHLPSFIRPGHTTILAPAAAIPTETLGSINHVPAPAESGSLVERLTTEASTLESLLRRNGEARVFANANFTLLNRTIPQTLLVRNALYFDPVFFEYVFPRLSTRQKAAIVLRRMLCLSSAYSVDTIMTPSATMQALVAASAPELSSKIFANPYGVDVGRFAAPDTRIAVKGELRIICHSLIAIHKPIWPILMAVSAVRERGIRATITLVDSPFRGEHALNPFCSEDRKWFGRGLAQGWIELIEQPDHEDIPRLLHESDVFVFHTLSESFGHPYVEALAAGLPAVVSDIPIARELCGDAALYFPPFCAADIADRLEYLAVDIEARLRAATAGVAVVERQQLSWERHFSRLAELINRDQSRGLTVTARRVAHMDSE